MFIKTLVVIYALLVFALLAVYLTNQRTKFVHWAELHGMKNNFFIRIIRKKPKKAATKSSLSKAFWKQD